MTTFVFDLDGTLLDTLADIGNACNHVLVKHGFATYPLDHYRYMVGNGFAMLIKRAVPAKAGLSESDLQALVDEAREWYGQHMMEETSPYPGMGRALEKLAQNGDVLCVLSNKPDLLSVELVRHYFPDIPFRKIAGAKDGVPLKPDPAALLAMLEETGAERERACYVGDSDVDMVTARNARIWAIGAGWGFRGAPELFKAGGDCVLARPEALKLFAWP